MHFSYSTNYSLNRMYTDCLRINWDKNAVDKFKGLIRAENPKMKRGRSDVYHNFSILKKCGTYIFTTNSSNWNSLQVNSFSKFFWRNLTTLFVSPCGLVREKFFLFLSFSLNRLKFGNS